MTKRAPAARFFTVGGTMDPDAPSYVERRADAELLDHLLASDVCSILSPRQMGKSSLIARAMARLEKRSVECVTVDLQRVGTASLSTEEFYLSVLHQVSRQLTPPMTLPSIQAWWRRRRGLTAVDRFATFLEDAVIGQPRRTLAVFVDEIDKMLDVTFSDEFFGCLRALYNARARNADLRRLTFVLSGVAAPRDLVKDENLSPFNIGHSIELTDFTITEALKLTEPWSVTAPGAERLLKRVLYWTGGHPYLTHRLCAEVAETRPGAAAEQDIDRVAGDLFFTERTWEDMNLQWVRSALVKDSGGELLDLYARIRSVETVADDKRSSLHMKLKLTGVVRVDATSRPRFRLANRVYEKVFDQDWVASVRGETATTSRAGGRLIGRDGVTRRGRGTHVEPAVPGGADTLAIYCRWLTESLGRLPLRGLDQGAGDPGIGREPLGLAEVYIDLETTHQVPDDPEGAPKRRGRPGEPDVRRLTALEAAAKNRVVVFLGDPGSGKSTFLNHLAFCLASHRTDPGGRWLAHLRGWPEHLADLVPVPVVLRDFGRSLAKGPGPGRGTRLWRFIQDRLRDAGFETAGEPLKEALERGKALILLDGLDEIPTKAGRKAVRDAVADFVRHYERSRYVITCRTLAYEEAEAQLEDAPTYQLAPFARAQIDRFIDAWYGELVRLGQVKPAARAGLATRLREAVGRDDLRWMATNPLLLTVMALVHTYKGVLPDARAQLYEDTVDLLLTRWEQVRTSGDDEAPLLHRLLAEARRSPVDLKRALCRLAFEIHGAGGGDAERLADVDEGRLVEALAALHPDRSPEWARRLIDVIRVRAGLLLERAPGLYTFPHRTFQEYLAGAELSLRSDFARTVARLLGDSAFWREAILLAVGRLVHVVGDSDKPLALVGELCPAEVRDDASSWRKAWVAGEALVEIGASRAGDSQLGRDLLARVRLRLRQLVERGRLSAVERVAAGNALGKLGDPRFREDAWFLPDDDLLGFVEIPASAFVMGSDPRDKRRFDDEFKEHEVKLSRYYLARYPVTVAQFKAFAGGKQFEREDSDWRQGVANHPVVSISWHEARAYCDWLTEQLSASDKTPRALADLLHGRTPDKRKWRVTLPSEAEWEKAARGPAPSRRVYPWGDEPDPDAANYAETGIGAISPAGCFPKGASQPYGALDLSGNVWEWTRSLWGEDVMKPDRPDRYVPGGAAENLKASDDVPRVLRGGAFDGYVRLVRCAVRYRFLPDYRGRYVGFRVAVSPFAADP
jgi:formylglycine-generating enzyme required for sulfatase activity/energy-coupling factor transporter ATP-binding protein EcfA2